MQLIVSVNEGLAAILSDISGTQFTCFIGSKVGYKSGNTDACSATPSLDISGETMGALLRGSYRNDEYLQLMLLTTGVGVREREREKGERQRERVSERVSERKALLRGSYKKDD